MDKRNRVKLLSFIVTLTRLELLGIPWDMWDDLEKYWLDENLQKKKVV